MSFLKNLFYKVGLLNFKFLNKIILKKNNLLKMELPRQTVLEISNYFKKV